MAIRLIQTGVPGFDLVLGGGLPERSFNVLGGDPGAGKTTLAHQILFSSATEDRPALFFTVVGEPPLKMLGYQKEFEFFDEEKVGTAVRYQNLTEQVLEGDLDAVYEAIVEEVERVEPAMVAVDSFRSVTHLDRRGRSRHDALQHFVQRLSNAMTRWEAVSFLIGEYHEDETRQNPLFTVADGVIWLRRHREGDSRVRKLEVAKSRGSDALPGRHVYRISSSGIRVYPRRLPDLPEIQAPDRPGRVSSGVQGLDEMMDGGFVEADGILVSGPSGSGKSVLGMQFAAAGIEAGERVVVASFEESPAKYLARAASLGRELGEAVEDGRLRLVHRRPLDLSVDETFEEIRDRVEEIGATRVVVDSLSGLEVMARGAQMDRLRESMARMVDTLTAGGVTVLLTTELTQSSNTLKFTPQQSSFLADVVILQRYVEIEGELELVMSVVKMRRSAHSRAFHRYGITDEGVVVGEALRNLRGILTGVPQMKERGRTTGDWEVMGKEQAAETEDRKGREERDEGDG